MGSRICNAGFPGENTEQLLHRLPDVLAGCHGVGVAVIFVGMNDAVNDKRFRSPEQTRSNVTAMLHQLAAQHVTAVIVTLHSPDIQRLMQRHSPSAYGDVPPAQRIDAANRALLQAANEVGARVADFHAALERAGGATEVLSTDGVHLTRAGYRLLADTVSNSLPPDAQKL